MRRWWTLVFTLALSGLALVSRAEAATFTVTNTNNSGTGSLRAAIQGANATTASDTVAFAIPGAGGHIISVTSPLPSIVHPLVINGESQPGYSGVPLVQLDNGAGASATGFDVSAGPSKVLGLSITRFLIGVRLQTGDGNAVGGDWIGLDLSGAGAGNGTGLVIKGGSASNTIGGTIGSLRNIVSGNGVGILLTGSGVTGNTLIGNCVGLGTACTETVPNTGAGLEISSGSAGNRIGGTTLPARNVISGNGGDGLLITGAGTSNNLVQGNYFGPDGADDEVFPNGGAGIRITAGASLDTVGGSSAGARNLVLEDSTDVAVAIEGSNTNVVAGNNITGGVPVVELSGGATGNTIGGTSSSAGNRIGNSLGAGVQMSDAGTTKNVVEGNAIGDQTPSAAALIGVLIQAGAAQNTVGGTKAGARNVIEGNASDGVRITGAGTNGNVVAGNQIGSDTMGNGTANAGAGVAIRAGAKGNTVGGTAAGAGNVIGLNSTDGVAISGAGTTGNIVAGNEVFESPDGVAITGGASQNTVGGSVALARNFFWFDGNGVLISGSATTGNAVQGNFVGVDVDGSSSLANGNGVELSAGAHGNTVGGANVISANTNGVLLTGTGTTGNTVQGNRIGIAASSNAAVPNHEGVQLAAGAHGNTIGGTTTAARNVISGNSDGGVLIAGAGTSTNVVAGNYIGTDAAGTGAVANDGGVFILSGATGNTIGGTTTAARNVISGNGTGVLILDNGSTNNKVLGNYVGTNAGGTAALGNTQFGIGTDADRTTIQGNVVSGNGGDGIDLDTANASVVAGNLVGTSAGGTAAVPNSGEGIKLLEGASGNTIGGTTTGARNVVSGNQDDGICLDNAGPANVVEGNYVGIGATGGALGNGFDGICLRNSANGNTIGGTTAAQRNVVSKNGENGIHLDSVESSVVEGNYLGTNVAGSTAFGNGSAGVFLSGSSFHNTIGGTAAGTRNVISGNTAEGVLISGATADDNFVEGNYIGTNAVGSAPVANAGDGVLVVEGGGNVIGGTTAGTANVVSGNAGTGVEILDDGNVVEGNLIGTNAAGTAKVGNDFGVKVRAGGGTRVGGTSAATRNVVSGNAQDGILVDGATTDGTLVEGNYVGLGADGSTKLGNGESGTAVTGGATNTTIGGTAAGAENVVSGNDGDGVLVSGSGTTGTQIEGNLIGTDASGTLARGNGRFGVNFAGGADGNTVGGTGASAANTIAFSDMAGVVVDDSIGATNGETIERNSIFSNGGLGIDLIGNGNDSIPAPNVDSVTTANGTTKITVSLGANVAVFRVEVFVSPSCDPSGSGEGKTFLAAKNIDANQTSTGTVSVAQLASGQAVTATETDLNNGDTSEFSTCFTTP